MNSPLVIPFFIAHQGCPHQCSFCNQHVISGAPGGKLAADEIHRTVNDYLASDRKSARCKVQVAFYGGSFTGLPTGRQMELLRAVQPFLISKEVDEIRLSTRPDYITPEIVGFLRAEGVGVVELGVQSMDDNVLKSCGRGHSTADSEKAI